MTPMPRLTILPSMSPEVSHAHTILGNRASYHARVVARRDALYCSARCRMAAHREANASN